MAYKPGQSGNSKGRPKGLQDRRTAFRELVEPFAPKLTQKAIEMALEGNEPMLKLLLDRLLPAKPKENAVDLVLDSEKLVPQSRAVIKALSDGHLSPSDANTLMSMIAKEASIYSIEELTSRVAILEEQFSPESSSGIVPFEVIMGED